MQPADAPRPPTLVSALFRDAHLIQMVFPEQTNHYGTLFGGEALALMAKAAFVASSRHARRRMVLATTEQVDFHVPVRQGQLVDVVARVVAAGKTSLTLEVELHAEEVLTGRRELAAHGRLRFVALDEQGKATAVPALAAGGPADDPSKGWSFSNEAPPVELIEAGRLIETELVEVVFPDQTNHYGTLFGGQALALMDKAAFIAASRFGRSAFVTASSEKADFHVPVRQGALVELRARIASTGRTSLKVEVELHSEDLLTGERRLGTRGGFVLVALDSNGRPTPVPPLAAPGTETSIPCRIS